MKLGRPRKFKINDLVFVVNKTGLHRVVRVSDKVDLSNHVYYRINNEDNMHAPRLTTRSDKMTYAGSW